MPQSGLLDHRTKIVATVGPASRHPSRLTELINAGTNVFRLNMAHGSPGDHEKTVADIRSVSKKLGRTVGILVDLAGPKIRLGTLLTDPLECRVGQRYQIVRGTTAARPDEFVSTYDRLVDELSLGDRVMLADGTVSLVVEEAEEDRITCRVVLGGVLRSRQGINLPGVDLSVPTLTEEDRVNAIWAASREIDFVGLSFVRQAADIVELKSLLQEHDSQALVVAKIEKPDALESLDEIVATADAVMVARGDLGVETEVSQMPVEQKRIIRTCNRIGRPVIVATQMLDSMQHSSRPTRAETTDVANAILDGADACMLSGETAIGEYPLETVNMMREIMTATEASLRDQAGHFSTAPPIVGVHPITSATVFGAGQIAQRLVARLVVVATRTGASALAKSSQRDFIPTIAVSDSIETLRRVSLYWGITPLEDAPCLYGAKLRTFINDWGKRDGYLESADRVVMVTGSGIMDLAHNQVVVHEVN